MKNLTERLVVGGVALLVGLLLGWMVRGVATYNTGTETVTAYDDWRVACPAAKVKATPCQMISDIADPGGRGTVAQAVVTQDTGKPVLGFTLPFGVALEPGIGLFIGTDAVRVLPYKTCSQVGCIVLVPFDDKLRNALGAAEQARIEYSGLDGKQVPISISLKGYKTAQKAYMGSESRRASWFWRLWS